jgi:hypothetical protein
MKQWIFEKVQLAGFNGQPEWVLKISSLSQLFDYYKKTRPTLIREAIDNLMDTTGRHAQRDHFTNTLTWATAALSSMKAEGKDHGPSFIESLNELLIRVDKNQIRALTEGQTLYLRDIGSYSTDDGTMYRVLDSYSSDELKFPASQVRVIQWPGGKHWYAKVGDADVVVDGEQKWETKRQAEAMAKTFILRTWEPPVSVN